MIYRANSSQLRLQMANAKGLAVARAKSERERASCGTLSLSFGRALQKERDKAIGKLAQVSEQSLSVSEQSLPEREIEREARE